MSKNMLAKGITGCMGAMLLAATGCSVDVYSPPPREVVVSEPGPDVVVADEPPPAPQDDVVVGVAPGPDYVWVGGEYEFVGGRYVWHRGRWDRPPAGRRHWVGGRFENHGHGYVRVGGHWE